ncbi:MAG TPA: hypothetical protein DDW93_00385, partial [Firmicutes bacterium]|nr:hypothetical protein [Bacillota bacterium]
LQYYKFHLLELITENFKVPSFLYAFINKPEEIIVLYGLKHKDEEKELYTTTLAIQEQILKLDNISFSAGFGSLYPGLTSQTRSYREARLALEFKVWTGTNTLIPYKDIENSK